MCRDVLGLPGGVPKTPHSSSVLRRAPTTDRECVGQALARWRVEVVNLMQGEVGQRFGKDGPAVRHWMSMREDGRTDLSVRELLHLCSEEEAVQIVRDAYAAYEEVRVR